MGGTESVSGYGRERPPPQKSHVKLRGVSPADLFAAEIQGWARIREAAEIKRQTEQLSRVTHTYDQFAQGLSELARWRRQSWEITFWERARLVSSLQRLPESELRDNLRSELKGRSEVTAEWLARACELVRKGLSDIQADAGRVAARRSERISFEIEPQTSAEQMEGFRRLNVQRQQVEQMLADKVEPALPRDHMIGLIDAGGSSSSGT